MPTIHSAAPVPIEQPVQQQGKEADQEVDQEGFQRASKPIRVQHL